MDFYVWWIHLTIIFKSRFYFWNYSTKFHFALFPLKENYLFIQFRGNWIIFEVLVSKRDTFTLYLLWLNLKFIFWGIFIETFLWNSVPEGLFFVLRRSYLLFSPILNPFPTFCSSRELENPSIFQELIFRWEIEHFLNHFWGFKCNSSSLFFCLMLIMYITLNNLNNYNNATNNSNDKMFIVLFINLKCNIRFYYSLILKIEQKKKELS